MWQRFKDWWIEDLFGPRRKRRFLLRIRARVLKLRFQLWRRRPKGAVIRRHWRKPAALLLVGVLVPVLTGWLLSILFPDEARGFSTAIHNLLTNPAQFRLEWREAAQLLLLLVGVPAAFLLWLFRDINVSGTLENQRKDVNLREFQEIQMRAAGAMPETLPQQARETLQIAALHQMRAFLRGEYGESFRRPAFELFRARLAASAQVTGSQAIEEWLATWRSQPRSTYFFPKLQIQALREHSETILSDRVVDMIAETERTILREEWQSVFRAGMPVAGSTLHAACLDSGENLSEIDFSDCSFVTALLSESHLELAILSRANLGFARLQGAHLEAAVLSQAGLEGADLSGAHLEYADLREAKLQGANLGSACLAGADLTNARLECACLYQANLDSACLLTARLHGADLTGASLQGADLDGAHLWDTNFSTADLRGADLRGATLFRSNLATVDPAVLASCQGAEYDSGTIFDNDWSRLEEYEKALAIQGWIARGARMVKPGTIT